MSNPFFESTEVRVGVGGWSPYGSPSQTELLIFKEALGNDLIIGNAVYKPLQVASQLVAGIKYKFKCMVQPTDNFEPLNWEAVVEIFVPLSNGEPHVINVMSI
jgi:hypothetical protein